MITQGPRIQILRCSSCSPFMIGYCAAAAAAAAAKCSSSSSLPLLLLVPHLLLLLPPYSYRCQYYYRDQIQIPAESNPRRLLSKPKKHALPNSGGAQSPSRVSLNNPSCILARNNKKTLGHLCLTVGPGIWRQTEILCGSMPPVSTASYLLTAEQ